MSNRTKFKISRSVKKTKRGKGLYAASTLFVPEEIANEFTDSLFTVKKIGFSIVYTDVNQNKTKKLCKENEEPPE